MRFGFGPRVDPADKEQGGEPEAAVLGVTIMSNSSDRLASSGSGGNRPEGYSLTNEDAGVVKGMLARGDRQSDIAAWFGVNSGRVAEINTGLRHVDAVRANPDALPPPGPYRVSARSSLKALSTLVALRALIDDAIAEIAANE